MKCNKLCFVAQRFLRGFFFFSLIICIYLKRETQHRGGGEGEEHGV